ncbi:hypothetical protein QAD02_002945 [Eretmocerus hayati]|uniref:Uncharacterized protein n=1 Tax=Eretmocerus hayati TaxID=131215 RepID=A0ACC2NLA8_9HYME|nr:hypothetical protein QAD02_002945 [Eretmocerus hayati]
MYFQLHLGTNLWVENKTYLDVANKASSPTAFVNKMLLKLFHITDLMNATISGKPSNKTVSELNKLKKLVASKRQEGVRESDDEMEEIEERIRSLKEKIDSVVKIDEGKLLICRKCYELWLKNEYPKHAKNYDDSMYVFELNQFEIYVTKKISYLKSPKQRSRAVSSKDEEEASSSEPYRIQNAMNDDQELPNENQENLVVEPLIEVEDTEEVGSTDNDAELSDIDEDKH